MLLSHWGKGNNFCFLHLLCSNTSCLCNPAMKSDLPVHDVLSSAVFSTQMSPADGPFLDSTSLLLRDRAVDLKFSQEEVKSTDWTIRFIKLSGPFLSLQEYFLKSRLSVIGKAGWQMGKVKFQVVDRTCLCSDLATFHPTANTSPLPSSTAVCCRKYLSKWLYH